jgi:A/G-specific adenine glycosylase
MSVQEATDRLLDWARAHWEDRGLPWRAVGEPPDRRALVEGLLAQTRAAYVAAEYAEVFAGVETAADWLEMHEDIARARVAPLGLPQLKVRAVDGIARVLVEWRAVNDPTADPLDLLQEKLGIGPYTAGMVALLLGHGAAPVDCNVQRVADRCAPGAGADAWIAEVVAAAGPGTRIAEVGGALPAGYVAVSAVLDVGARLCRIGAAPRCGDCPLGGDCAFAARGPRQMELWR